MRRASEAIREPSWAYRGCFRSEAWGWSAARGARTVCSAWICRLCRGDDPARRTHQNTGWTWKQERLAVVVDLRFEGRYLGFRIMQMCMFKKKKKLMKRIEKWTHLRWWKSWNSGEGRKGRWYPQWEMVVLIRATQYHMQVVETWEPRITGPITTGIRLESCSREEEQIFVFVMARCPDVEPCSLCHCPPTTCSRGWA